jgi:UDP-N-acetylmuramoyl-L-alanyl-D-glutamate--2,6-diaminopimelate ligase
MATAVGLAYGIDLETIVRGLEAVNHVAGRLERIECGQPFGVFVDYAHTPHALATVLDTLRPVTAGKLICVFGAGGDRDAQKRPLMASAVESRADVTIVTTDNPRHEDPSEIARHIYSGFDEPQNVESIADRREAIERALAMAGTDDCVLIAGKGHETAQIVGGQRIAFDDRDIARRWLYNLSAAETLPWRGHSWMSISNS